MMGSPQEFETDTTIDHSIDISGADYKKSQIVEARNNSRIKFTIKNVLYVPKINLKVIIC